MAPAPQRCALVTTLLLPAGGASVVVSFVRWHLHVGFERIYLYFDEAVDEPVGWAELTAACCSTALRSPCPMRARSSF